MDNITYLLLQKGKKNLTVNKSKYCCIGCFENFKICEKKIMHRECFDLDPDGLRW